MTTKTKEGALKAARKKLGENAVEGVDFNIRNTGAGWDFEPIPAANDAAVKAKAKRAPKTIWAGDAAAAVNAGVKTAKTAKAHTPKQQNKSAGAKSAHAKRKAAAPKAPAETDTKTARFIEMLSAPGGATSKELEQAMGWQSHSVRGLIGTLKKRGVNVESKKLKGEPTFYRIVPKKAAPAPAEVGDVI